MGLIARALEMAGIATTLTSWHAGITRLANPPRGTVTKLERGQTVGRVSDRAQQRRVLEASLALLAHDAPVQLARLDEK